MKNIKEYRKAEDIEFFLANTPQITFEVKESGSWQNHPEGLRLCTNTYVRVNAVRFMVNLDRPRQHMDYT